MVPNAILLASLPESETEVGDSFGQRTLVALEKHFGRLECKPPQIPPTRTLQPLLTSLCF